MLNFLPMQQHSPSRIESQTFEDQSGSNRIFTVRNIAIVGSVIVVMVVGGVGYYYRDEIFGTVVGAVEQGSSVEQGNASSTSSVVDPAEVKPTTAATTATNEPSKTTGFNYISDLWENAKDYIMSFQKKSSEPAAAEKKVELTFKEKLLAEISENAKAIKNANYITKSVDAAKNMWATPESYTLKIKDNTGANYEETHASIQELFEAYAHLPANRRMTEGIDESFFMMDNDKFLLPVVIEGRTVFQEFAGYEKLMEVIKSKINGFRVVGPIDFVALKYLKDKRKQIDGKEGKDLMYVLKFSLPTNMNFDAEGLKPKFLTAKGDRKYYKMSFNTIKEYAKARAAVTLNHFSKFEERGVRFFGDIRSPKEHQAEHVEELPVISGTKRDVLLMKPTDLAEAVVSEKLPESHKDYTIDFENIYVINTI